MDWMHILSIAFRVVLVILLVGLVIFVHELGHFLAARRLGLVVDTFSLGFGPALWKRTSGGVEYRIGLIPLGGYVAIPQLDPAGMEKIQGNNKPEDEKKDAEPPRELPPIAPWKRIVVSIAGPLGNVLLSLVLAWWIYLSPQAGTGAASTQIGLVETNSPAWFAGLRPGQVIERVNGERVSTWYDFMIECHLAGDPAQGVALHVNDNGAIRDLRVPLATKTNAGIRLGAIDGLLPKVLCHVEDVVSNSAAATGGVKGGDIFLALNGRPIAGAQEFVGDMAANGTNSVRVDLMRGIAKKSLVLMPQMDPAAGKALLGVHVSDAFLDVPPWMQYSKPWRQISSDASQVFRLLRALIFPQHKGEAGRAANSVGGMPTIVVVLWGAIQSGLLSCLGLLRMIGINLAIINLLPIPVLDGGHVLVAVIEGITRRKPNPRVLAVVTNFFAVLIIGLMLLLIVRDPVIRPLTDRFWARHVAASAAAATNAPPEGTPP